MNNAFANIRNRDKQVEEPKTKKDEIKCAFHQLAQAGKKFKFD